MLWAGCPINHLTVFANSDTVVRCYMVTSRLKVFLLVVGLIIAFVFADKPW